MRVTLVRGRLREVDVPSSSVSRVRGGRVLGLVVELDSVVRSGLMSLVMGGLVLVIVAVVVDVPDLVVLADDAGGT